MLGPRILIVFHSVEGQTAKIVDRMATRLRERGDAVEDIDATRAPEPRGYDGVLVGDSIHASHHSRALRHYLREHADSFGDVPVGLFQVSLTSVDDDEEHRQRAQSFVDELLEETGLQPDLVGQFAGALAYQRYGWLKRRMMRRIARSEGRAETDMTRDYEFTDWDEVDAFAGSFHEMVMKQAA